MKKLSLSLKADLVPLSRFPTGWIAKDESCSSILVTSCLRATLSRGKPSSRCCLNLWFASFVFRFALNMENNLRFLFFFFFLLFYALWLVLELALISQPIISQTETNHVFVIRVSPHFASSTYWFIVLTSSVNENNILDAFVDLIKCVLHTKRSWSWQNPTAQKRRLQGIAILMYKVKNKLCPTYFQELLNENTLDYNLASSNFIIPRSRLHM